MFCSECGQQIEDGSRFCSHCGAAQAKEQQGGAAAKKTDPLPLTAVRPKSTNYTGRTIGVIAAVLLLFIFVASLGSKPTSTSQGIERNGDALADSTKNVADAVTKPDLSGSSWSYSTDVDKVRGGTSYFATTTSTNSIHQDPPYDADTTMGITVRLMPSSGTDVVLTISSGQLMCPSYEGCRGTVRFDNGAAQPVSFNGPADSSSDTIFVVGAKAFVAKLKKAKKVIIEKTIYEAGNPQFEFDVSGLKWDH